MSTLEKAARQALEALEPIHHGNMTPMAENAWKSAITALREALSGVQALSAAPAIGDELRDTLVAVSAAIAERDDRAAQKMIREILAASPTPPAEQHATKETSGGFHVWRDISTAPKDGSRFVATGYNYGLYSEGRHICVAQWFRGCWMETSDWNEASELTHLTHWLPLPSPPDDVAAPAEQQAAPKAAPGEPVHGDVLPPVGSRVYIRHGRDNDAHACTVTGYYAWGDLGGDKRLHRVFVRLVYEGTDRQQARMLCDCYPTAEAALAQAAPQQEAQEPIAWTPGPNLFKDWCAQWFGPDSDYDYLAKAVFNLPPMAQVFKEAAPQQSTTKSAPVATFEDAQVQVVYNILVDDEAPPAGEHWEGFIARRIVDALAATKAAPGGREQEFEKWLATYSTLSAARDVNGYADLTTEMLWHAWQAAAKTKAPEGASAEWIDANARPGLALTNYTCAHDFSVQPSSGIRLCQKCGISETAARKAAPQQEAQEPATAPRFNCWSTNEGDSWFDHPADAQAIYDCLGNDANVGDEYELTAGWKSVTARYRITEVVGDGEEYEVECISHPQGNTAPQPAPAPLSDEVARDAARLEFAMQHGMPMECSGVYRYHGFVEAGWHPTKVAAIDAALAAQGDTP